MSQQLYQATHKMFTLTVYDDCISIKKKGSLLGLMTNSTARGGFSAAGVEKRIFYSVISSIQYRKPSKLDYGEIIFDFPGAPKYQRNSGETGFLFSKKEAEIMDKAYEYIQGKINEKNVPQGVVVQSAPSSADELIKFKQLLDSGIITQEEFDAKKKQILGL